MNSCILLHNWKTIKVDSSNRPYSQFRICNKCGECQYLSERVDTDAWDSWGKCTFSEMQAYKQRYEDRKNSEIQARINDESERNRAKAYLKDLK